MSDTEPDESAVAEAGASPLRILLTVLGVFLVLCAATTLLPHDRYIRYQQLSDTLQFRLVWSYDRIHHDPAPIDIALVGVSRTEAAISAPTISRQLSEAFGTEINFANLSMPQQGRNAHYAVAKDLLETRPELQVLVLSVVEQMPRTPHPVFRNIAEVEDVIGAPRLINTNYVSDLAFMPWRQFSLFVQSQAPAAFGNRTAFDEEAYEGTDMDSTHSFLSATGSYVDRDRTVPREELERDADAYLAGMTPPLLPQGLVEYEFATERDYLRAIGDLAEARGVEVIFLYIPIYKGPDGVDTADYTQPYGPMLSANFISGDYRLFSDYGHTNRAGSALVTPWFAGQLLELIESGEIAFDPAKEGQ